MAEKPNFLNAVLQGLGLGKEPPKPPTKSRPTGNLQGRSTAPLGGHPDRAQQVQDSKDRRFLISVYQTHPTLLPSFGDPQYMYKLIGAECEYLHQSIDEKEAERKHLEDKERNGTMTPREQWRFKALPAELQVLQEEYNRFLPLLKKVTNQTGPLPKPLSPEEKARQSEQRRYLIGAYEEIPVLIPEFKDPQYMYRLLGDECDYTQECIREKEEALKLLTDKEKLTPKERSLRQLLEEELQVLQTDLARFQALRKKVTERPAEP